MEVLPNRWVKSHSAMDERTDQKTTFDTSRSRNTNWQPISAHTAPELPQDFVGAISAANAPGVGGGVVESVNWVLVGGFIWEC